MTTILQRHLDLNTLHEKPVIQKERVTPKPKKPIDEIAKKWMSEFNEAITSKEASAVAELFQEDGWWRDVLAMSWDFHTYQSAKSIKEMIERNNTSTTGLSNFCLDPAKTVSLLRPGGSPEFGDCIQVFFLFETKVGNGRGLVRLTPDSTGDTWKAFTFYTSLQELKGHEERRGASRPKGVNHGEQGDRKIWLEERRQLLEMEGVEPTVLVIGSGQGGLNIAARLGQLNIPTLIIDKNERVGDNWRKRYKTLVLHDPVWYDHLSYIPFPPHWPIFTPKDKLADWFEAYVKSMELNVWTSTTIQDQPTYEAKSHTWTINLKRPDGSIRTLHPRHIVLASGHSGEPRIPRFPGSSKFKGDIHHSSSHPGGYKYRGKKAVVVGCCNSGHDIAMDFFEQGAESVTLVQRSSTYIMSSDRGLFHLFEGLYEEGGPSTEDADLIFSSIPYPVHKTIQQHVTKKVADDDKEILTNLEKAGFKVDYGYDGTGFIMKYFIRGGGYYIDVGCSKLIGDGKIKVKQGKEITEIVEDGLIFEDGSKLEADVIVLATGYDNMRETARKIFGDQLADNVRDVWGLNDEGELSTIWQNSGHEGFWFMGGNLALARTYSKFLALQIKAVELGLRETKRSGSKNIINGV